MRATSFFMSCITSAKQRIAYGLLWHKLVSTCKGDRVIDETVNITLVWSQPSQRSRGCLMLIPCYIRIYTELRFYTQCSHCKRCTSYGNSVRPSVCHTPVLCQNDCVFTGFRVTGLPVRGYVFHRYLGHPLTSTENFTEIVPGEPLRRVS